MLEGEAAVAETAIQEALSRRDFEAVVTLALSAHGQALTAFVQTRVPSSNDAEEVMAEVTAALWAVLPRLELHTSLRGYLFQMARHGVHRHLARDVRRGRQSVSVEDVDSAVLGPDPLRTGTPPYLRTANKDRIAMLRASLSQEEQTVLQLRVDQGLSFREIAQAMAPDGETLDGAAITRDAARWRKRYQLTKDRLRALATEAGLLEP